MTLEDPKNTAAEQPSQEPEQAPAPLPPESLEPVSVPPSPEDQARAAETLAHMQEAAAEAPATDATPETAPAATATLSREDIVQILQERQHGAGHAKSYPKASVGILGATAAILSFFGALFASLFEKLGGALGMKSEGGAKSAAKPAGGGGHH